MVLVGYLAANKALNNRGIETFRNKLKFNESSKINYSEYYNSVLNSTIGYVCICIFILINVIPALLIALNCNHDYKIAHLIVAFIFSDVYVFVYAVRRFIYNDKKYCL
tara:strand:+ start:168 stop:491 length:324 start_codon:yes stop_codon:yes gene_type:complete